MKRYLLIIAMLLGAVSSWGQAANDQAAVLQKIVDLPELQQYYPKNADGKLKQLYISQSPTAFTTGVIEAMGNYKVQFQTPEAIKAKKADSYFAFRSIVIDNETATANVNYMYDISQESGQVKMLNISISLQKAGTAWNITNLNIGGDTK